MITKRNAESVMRMRSCWGWSGGGGKNRLDSPTLYSWRSLLGVENATRRRKFVGNAIYGVGVVKVPALNNLHREGHGHGLPRLASLSSSLSPHHQPADDYQDDIQNRQPTPFSFLSSFFFIYFFSSFSYAPVIWLLCVLYPAFWLLTIRVFATFESIKESVLCFLELS